MSDIVIPPVTPVPPAIAAALATAAALAVARLPAELIGMAAGTILQGTVISREANGQTVIRTQYGALTFKGATPLPVGSAVTLQIQQTGTQLQVVVLSVDGARPEHASPTREQPVPTAPQPQPRPQPAPAPFGMLRDAVGFSPKPLMLEIVRVTGKLADMSPGTILQGTVSGREPTGETVIRTPIGAVTVKGGESLPVGAGVTVKIEPPGPQRIVAVAVDHTETTPAPPARGPFVPTTPPSAAPAVPAPAATGTLSDAARMLTGHWDALAEALNAAPDLHAIVPRAAADLGARVFAFLQALERGSITEWVGRELHRALAPPLAARLGDDFAHMAQLNTTDPDPGEWRFVPIPLVTAGNLGQILLFTRGGRRPKPAPDEDSGARVLVELDTAHLGKIQLDGLVHHRRFDLIVRTRNDLAPGMCSDITTFFLETRDLAHLTGDIAFITGEFVSLPLAAAKSPGVTA
jgi:hypothetical protein